MPEPDPSQSITFTTAEREDSLERARRRWNRRHNRESSIDSYKVNFSSQPPPPPPTPRSNRSVRAQSRMSDVRLPAHVEVSEKDSPVQTRTPSAAPLPPQAVQVQTPAFGYNPRTTGERVSISGSVNVAQQPLLQPMLSTTSGQNPFSDPADVVQPQRRMTNEDIIVVAEQQRAKANQEIADAEQQLARTKQEIVAAEQQRIKANEEMSAAQQQRARADEAILALENARRISTSGQATDPVIIQGAMNGQEMVIVGTQQRANTDADWVTFGGPTRTNTNDALVAVATPQRVNTNDYVTLRETLKRECVGDNDRMVASLWAIFFPPVSVYITRGGG